MLVAEQASMRFLFHALLALAVGSVLAGVAMGVEARMRREDDELRPSAMHTARMRRGSYERLPIESTIAPPLPVAPRYAAEVVGPPRLVWRLSEGADGARIELCPTNDFDEASVRRLDVVGDEVMLPSPWPAGVWYWRLRGRAGGDVGDRATPTWMLYVKPATAAGGPADLGAIALRVDSRPSPWLVTHDPPAGVLLPIYDPALRQPSEQEEPRSE
jgi:hypothetical protein